MAERDIRNYGGQERREFVRIDYTKPLACKVCSLNTLSKLFQGYTINISQSGLLCNISDTVNINDILWLSFERGVLRICEEIEKRSLIYQRGVIGKVVRVRDNENGSFNIGIQFLTREENNAPDMLGRFKEMNLSL